MITYEVDRRPKDLKADFTLKECFFGDAKLSKNADPDKYFIQDMV